MKLMLEKTAASEATPTDDVIRPDPVEVSELENDEFIPQSFVSKRTDKLTKVIINKISYVHIWA